MSFIDNAAALLDRTETSLHSLIVDALKARAYREIATIASMAEQVSVIAPDRSGRRASAAPEVAATAPAAAEATKGSEPFWMRPKV